MRFIDEATIEVQAGHGGSGYKHFRREKYAPMGGPDGGDGGKGGSVILRADGSKGTLLDFRFRPIWEAEGGKAGGYSNQVGRSGKDLVVCVPPGTQVFRLPAGRPAKKDPKSQGKLNSEDSESAADGNLGEFVVDLTTAGEEFVLCKGGRGGRGNNFFKSSTNRIPEHVQPGEAGEAGFFRLSLKLVADVGIIGFPNAGKSSLISRLSAARPKIADYPFTTLVPNLGVVQGYNGRSYVIADIPGIVEGAHQGKGLGIQFLKHVERTRFLVHLIEIDHLTTEENVVEKFEVLNRELSSFSESLSCKPQMVAISKIDKLSQVSDEESAIGPSIEKCCQIFHSRGIECVPISSLSGQGLELLKRKIYQHLFPLNDNILGSTDFTDEVRITNFEEGERKIAIAG